MSTDSQSSSILLVNDCKTRVTSLKPSISPSAMCWSRWAESDDHFSMSINCVPAKWTCTILSNSNSHWNVGTCTKNLYRVYWFFLLFFLFSLYFYPSEVLFQVISVLLQKIINAVPSRSPLSLQPHVCMLLLPLFYLQMRMIMLSHPIGTINIYLPHSQVLLIT